MRNQVAGFELLGDGKVGLETGLGWCGQEDGGIGWVGVEGADQRWWWRWWRGDWLGWGNGCGGCLDCLEHGVVEELGVGFDRVEGTDAEVEGAGRLFASDGDQGLVGGFAGGAIDADLAPVFGEVFPFELGDGGVENGLEAWLDGGGDGEERVEGEVAWGVLGRLDWEG